MICSQQALEEYVTSAGRELQRQLMQDQLDARAAAEVRLEQVTGADGVIRRRAETGHARLVATTVGRVQVTRIAYRTPGAPNLHPADKLLSLPDGLYSFPLQRLVVHRVAGGSLRAAREALIRGAGQYLGTRQLMQIATEAAVDIRDFYQQAASVRPDPAGRGGNDVLVLSIDATGVNMIPSDLREPTPLRPAGPQPPSAQLSRRERTGRTRMAVVTALYDAAPAPRTAADILPADAAERAARRNGPQASSRKVDASLQHSVAPMVAALFDQAQSRDPHHQRRWVCLVDGANHQLECLEAEANRRGVQIDIVVDFIHVLEYLWRAAEDLHPTHPARAAFVAATARNLLEGHAPSVVADLRARLRGRGSDNPAPGLQRAIAYLHAKEPYLNYHIALTLGWPIATGVIEGSCRYLVKDRLDITGARWSLQGAEAILLLRAVIANGDFDTYWQYHLNREHQRTHASRYKDRFALAA
ncbi:ISKra4 family transposase [Allorhizocola rhizosphaerae]|uniref:ISKra4 family transposase n=1 Tax=Allorhizocola rhizosphaerae TaxID=1872709 RepID=UPI0024821982|nr:ISKra4 family transposase [Allorhizocola rhizosphaerae]